MKCTKKGRSFVDDWTKRTADTWLERGYFLLKIHFVIFFYCDHSFAFFLCLCLWTKCIWSMSTKTFRALNRLSLASEQRRFRNDEIPWEGKIYILKFPMMLILSRTTILFVSWDRNCGTIMQLTNNKLIHRLNIFFENVTINLLRTK